MLDPAYLQALCDDNVRKLIAALGPLTDGEAAVLRLRYVDQLRLALSDLPRPAPRLVVVSKD